LPPGPGNFCRPCALTRQILPIDGNPNNHITLLIQYLATISPQLGNGAGIAAFSSGQNALGHQNDGRS